MSGGGAGTWVPLAHQPGGNVGVMLLLSDGTVMCEDGGGHLWYRLTPDQNGSYVNGTWTTSAPMVYEHIFFASQVLQDGRVFVAGGEYGAEGTAEVYDPVLNTWTPENPPVSLLDTIGTSACTISTPPTLQDFEDMISEILPNGSVLMAPVEPMHRGDTLIYNPTTKAWSSGGTLANSACHMWECSWVKLADGSILAIDTGSQTSQRYILSLNNGQGGWVPDADLPVSIWNQNPPPGAQCCGGDETGPALLLPNGRAFFAGGNGSNVLYTPSGNTSPGTWTAGPSTPNSLQAADSPGAMMVNGKVLLAVAAVCFNGGCNAPWFFYEYDYSVGANGSFIEAPAPTGFPNPGFYIPFMLDLPDGTVLLSGNAPQLYVYRPDGSPLAVREARNYQHHCKRRRFLPLDRHTSQRHLRRRQRGR